VRIALAAMVNKLEEQFSEGMEKNGTAWKLTMNLVN
jgi:hypothetical protein